MPLSFIKEYEERAEITYIKAESVLPKKLIEEIQKYVQGEMIYISKPKEVYEKWGVRSGVRQYLDERNELIKQAFKSGSSISQLAEQHYLSVETIKK